MGSLACYSVSYWIAIANMFSPNYSNSVRILFIDTFIHKFFGFNFDLFLETRCHRDRRIRSPAKLREIFN